MNVFKVGDKYGSKLITNRIGTNLIAQCPDCKKETVITTTNIKYQVSKDCRDCQNKNRVNKDLIKLGDRFGRRVVTGFKNSYQTFLKCDCGHEALGHISSLLKGACQKCKSCLDKPTIYKAMNNWTTFDEAKPAEHSYIITWSPDLKKDFPTGIFKGMYFKDVYLTDEKFRSCLWLKIKSPL